MQRVNTSRKIVWVGLAAMFLGISVAQVARADTFSYRTWNTIPDTTNFVDTTMPLTRSVVIDNPVVLDNTTDRVIESPVMMPQPATIFREKDSHHLLNLKLF